MSSPEAFARAWNAAESVEEAARELGVLKTSASVRASILRASGYQLKYFATGRKVPAESKATAAPSSPPIAVITCTRGRRSASDVRCGFPAGDGVCGVHLEDPEAGRIRPGLVYCPDHYERAMRAKAASARR